MASSGSQNACCPGSAGAGCSGGERINSFSLVNYIPGDLGDRLTRLREELVPRCTARSHVTILPPRPIAIAPEEAARVLRRRLADYPAFEIELPRLQIFDGTFVVFADIGEGREQLLRMHASLGTGPFEFSEAWEYHPHVTLAQGLSAEAAIRVFERLARQWRPVRFTVDRLTFVQNTVGDRWVDLVDYSLDPADSLVGCGLP